MRASTLFATTIALLLGLGAIVGAKYTGIFEPKAPPEERRQAPPQILVAAQNLFEGTVATANQVRVRPLRDEELPHYEANRDKYMPALTAAAHQRILAKNVTADTPLLKEYFQDQDLPPDLSHRLDPGMRAVNITVPKDQAAGGMLRVGEYVDVYLTTSISNGATGKAQSTQTAMLAKQVKILVKRNNIWNQLLPPDDKPVDFTLQLNPYRAALLEYAKNAGTITLIPTPAPAHAARDEGTKAAIPASYSIADSAEYRDEDQRVAGILNGELAIGPSDLERIFRLKPIPGPEKERAPIRIVRWSGTKLQGATIFNPDGSVETLSGSIPPDPSRVSPMGGMGYSFNTVGAKP